MRREKRTLKADHDVMRFEHFSPSGHEITFQWHIGPKGDDIRVLAYFDAADLAAMAKSFDEEGRVNGVTCETRFLPQVREMIDYGCDLSSMRRTMEAALALLDAAAKEP